MDASFPQIRPKKSLGQHFLTSLSALNKMISATNLKKGETVLEIGPGKGILTAALLGTEADKIIAVEKDGRSYGFLSQRFEKEISTDRLKLVLGDILGVDRHTAGLDERRYVLAANIPYYITGAILQSFLEHEPRPNRMVLLVQKEVADRIIARDGKESLLSVSVKAFGEPHIVSKVPRGAFNPPPKVDSAILAIKDVSGDRFKDIDTQAFFKMLKAGFAHKRKMLKRNLESVYGKSALDQAWAANGISEKIRAEELSVDRWFGLALSLRHYAHQKK
ncbi:MAG: ribosomal RNA small subunit methyltransferase A [Patescibacteria group bacterium]|nr:ribosomal RNA small subunit methyltransferase A [Patescibacteria group bacterium]